MSSASLQTRNPNLETEKVNALEAPLSHLLAFGAALAVAYAARRAIGGFLRRAGDALPVLLGIGAALAWLGGRGLLRPELVAALAGSILILYAGLLARERAALLRRLNWLILLGCCLWVASSGVLVESVKVPFAQRFLALGNFALPLTVAWLWAVAYLIASPAQAEETAVGLSLVVSAVFLVISVLQAGFMGPLPAALSSGVFGCCLGVMLGSPSRLTASAGPAGRSMLGLMLATISVVGALKNTAFLVLVIPFLLLALPLMQVTYVLVSARRAAAPREEHEPATPDQSLALGRKWNSLTGYLLASGLSQRQVALLFYLAAAFLGAVAILLVLLIEAHFAFKLLLLALLLPGGFLLFFAAQKMLSPVGEGKGSVQLFGIPIANLTSQQTLDRIAEFICSQRPHHVVTSDSLMLLKAQQDEEFRRILLHADLITPDGTGVIWAGRLLGQPLREKVSGVELVERVSEISAQRGFSLFLLGGKPGVAEEAAQVLLQRYPGLKVSGTHHGYFFPHDEAGIVVEIARLRPDVLFVGLGAPRQEKWITRNLDRLGVPVCIGVGGSFDVISGRLARAPLWMQNWGLEWLYRAMKEPKRLPRLLGLPRFALMTVRLLTTRALQRSRR